MVRHWPKTEISKCPLVIGVSKLWCQFVAVCAVNGGLEFTTLTLGHLTTRVWGGREIISLKSIRLIKRLTVASDLKPGPMLTESDREDSVCCDLGSPLSSTVVRQLELPKKTTNKQTKTTNKQKTAAMGANRLWLHRQTVFCVWWEKMDSYHTRHCPMVMSLSVARQCSTVDRGLQTNQRVRHVKHPFMCSQTTHRENLLNGDSVGRLSTDLVKHTRLP